MSTNNSISDYLIRGTLKDLKARFVFTDIKTTVATGIKTHNTDPVSSFILGRALTTAALLSPLLEGTEKYSFRWEYSGLLSLVLADVNAKCDVRGIIKEPHLAAKAQTEDSIYGDTGKISVIKSDNGKILNSGYCKAALMEVVEDAAFFFSTSDQLETSMSVVIEFNPDPENPVKNAAGFMIQAMPECDLKIFQKHRDRLNTEEFKKILKTENISEEKKLWLLIKYILCMDENATENDVKAAITYQFSSSPSFTCSCSKEKMAGAVSTLSKKEIEEIFSTEDSIKINCEFCNTEYKISRSDVKK